MKAEFKNTACVQFEADASGVFTWAEALERAYQYLTADGLMDDFTLGMYSTMKQVGKRRGKQTGLVSRRS